MEENLTLEELEHIYRLTQELDGGYRDVYKVMLNLKRAIRDDANNKIMSRQMNQDYVKLFEDYNQHPPFEELQNLARRQLNDTEDALEQMEKSLTLDENNEQDIPISENSKNVLEDIDWAMNRYLSKYDENVGVPSALDEFCNIGNTIQKAVDDGKLAKITATLLMGPLQTIKNNMYNPQKQEEAVERFRQIMTQELERGNEKDSQKKEQGLEAKIEGIENFAKGAVREIKTITRKLKARGLGNEHQPKDNEEKHTMDSLIRAIKKYSDAVEKHNLDDALDAWNNVANEIEAVEQAGNMPQEMAREMNNVLKQVQKDPMAYSAHQEAVKSLNDIVDKYQNQKDNQHEMGLERKQENKNVFSQTKSRGEMESEDDSKVEKKEPKTEVKSLADLRNLWNKLHNARQDWVEHPTLDKLKKSNDLFNEFQKAMHNPEFENVAQVYYSFDTPSKDGLKDYKIIMDQINQEIAKESGGDVQQHVVKEKDMPDKFAGFNMGDKSDNKEPETQEQALLKLKSAINNYRAVASDKSASYADVEKAREAYNQAIENPILHDFKVNFYANVDKVDVGKVDLVAYNQSKMLEKIDKELANGSKQKVVEQTPQKETKEEFFARMRGEKEKLHAPDLERKQEAKDAPQRPQIKSEDLMKREDKENSKMERPLPTPERIKEGREKSKIEDRQRELMDFKEGTLSVLKKDHELEAQKAEQQKHNESEHNLITREAARRRKLLLGRK